MISELEGALSDLKELNKKIINFIQKIKKYPLGHKFFKDKNTKLLREIRGVWLRLKKKSALSERPDILEIGKLLEKFQSLDTNILKSYKEISSELTLKIQELEIDLEVQEKDELIERIYDKGSRFHFHIDIKNILKRAKKEVFIIDPYIDDDLLEMYLKKLDPHISISVLTKEHNPVKNSFIKVGKIFKKQHSSNFDAREINCIHDRAVFIDNSEGWVMGQSIKDAAKNKPTYLLKLKNSGNLEAIYMTIWSSSKSII